MGRGDSRSEGRRLRESDSRCALDRESRRLGDVGLLDDMMSVVESVACKGQSVVPLLRGRACEASGCVQAMKKDGGCGGLATVLDKQISACRGNKRLV
jgi:hypothetical protein